MKKKLLLIISVILLTTSLFVVVYVVFIDHEVKEEVLNNLFSGSVEFDLNCSKDLVGVSMDGSFIYYYSYSVDNIGHEMIISNEFPKFSEVFKDRSIVNENFSGWKKTPYERPMNQYLLDLYNLDQLGDNTCSKSFHENRYLDESGNYYCYYGAYPIGIYLIVYVPKESKLYVLQSKGI